MLRVMVAVKNRLMIKAVVKLILLAIWLAISIALLWLVNKTRKKKWHEGFCRFSYAVVCMIVELRVRTEGEMENGRPLLLVSNHISYLDILVLGAKTPAIFTPKSEMSRWPVVSTICRLLNCVFIERSSDKIKEARVKIHDALAKGEVVSLFPEGTTGDGRHLLPFKSSLFSIAEEEIKMPDGDKELLIQPAIISYISVSALPIDSTQWPNIAWYGDMILAPHVWKLLQLGKIDAKLTFLPAVTISQLGGRKELATHCYSATVEVLQSRYEANR
jgi:lyso-ornithine lipid O-acyltransferase